MTSPELEGFDPEDIHDIRLATLEVLGDNLKAKIVVGDSKEISTSISDFCDQMQAVAEGVVTRTDWSKRNNGGQGLIFPAAAIGIIGKFKKG